jgi:hypothetical protein
MLFELLHVLPGSSVYIDVATFLCQGHLMNAENDSADSEDPNWAYPLLRTVLTGAFIEIIAATILRVLSGIGFVPMPLMPVVGFFVAGAFLTGSWAIGCFLLYVRIRPQLIKDPDR